jgi:hypothetical protein
MILKIAKFYRLKPASCDCDVSRLEASLFKQVCRHHKPCLDTRNDNSKARINLGSSMFKLKIIC